MSRSQSIVLSTILFLAGCKKSPPPDSLCSIEPIPSTTRVDSGQGAILLAAPTDEYFYIQDTNGKQVGSHHVNAALAIKAGEYKALLNKSTHDVFVQEKMLTRCLTSSLNVTGFSDEYYYVYDSAGSQLASAHLNKTVALFPGQYQVQVNKTRASADLKANTPTEIKAGALQVAGKTEEYYYVYDSAATQLASAPINKIVSLLPGQYTVQVNKTKLPADIKPGATTELQAGVLDVAGGTEEYYYVYDNAGTQLSSSVLGKPVSLFPGEYQVQVNKTRVPAKVESGQAVRIETGTLSVQGKGADYYYVYNTAGEQLASSQLSRPVSLAAGTYNVRLGQQSKPASITAGQKTAVTF